MKRLIIALQKSGRLQEGSLELLKECGLKVDYRNGQLKVFTSDYPAELLFLRNSDIPQYVADGVVDLGIVGSNLLEEDETPIEIVQALNFSKCRVSFAVPKTSNIQTAQDLHEKRIATSYPNSVRKYLLKEGITADIHTISGSVEIAPSLDLADAIADIVSTGNTLFQNNLREVFPFLYSEAVLIKGKNFNSEKQALLDELVFRIQSVLAGNENKYILLNAPEGELETICKILPGMKSPTILPLAIEGWMSVHSVVKQKEVWQIVQQLKTAGAEGILVCPIEKMVS
ncbi:ATP phosphoribosyltransferase [Fluviicola taffensis]|uniref:ATP phosphoribosyltransferase n=1 Tax=Fluviicola taffensis (strain DSM 16823 / NCIMB 13979 / RW262) TaxID=755732 RepID=F2IDA7_FLUTR|nr:ATP phosphoribosyltransferase [Fluviicola taffensis]AEA45522.1 ATP phosphoribosyltransferase [Fluviicola taffensis DSM 16823]